MSTDIDDPRLTAYALGELEGQELAELERQLQAEPQLQDEVEQIRSAAGWLTGNLDHEPLPELTPSQEQALRLAATPRKRSAGPGRTLPLRTLLALAASVLILCSLSGLFVYSLFLPVPNDRLANPQRPEPSLRKPGFVSTPGMENVQPPAIGTEAPSTPQAPMPAAGPKPLVLGLPRPQFVGTPADIRHLPLRPPPLGDRPMPMVPSDARNVARGKTVTASENQPVLGDLAMVTDGKKEGQATHVELPAGPQWVQIDLGEEHEVFAIVFWHYFLSARVYHDVVVQAGSTADFAGQAVTLFNNDRDNSLGLGSGSDMPYVDNHEGELVVPRRPLRARYIRLYSNGNTANELNHMVEVEVYGRPAAGSR